MYSHQSPPRGERPPHIRLNSDHNDLLVSDDIEARAGRSLTAPPARQLPHPPQLQSALPGLSDSSELLLPPSPSTRRPLPRPNPRDRSPRSPSSRRSSWSSEASASSRLNPFASPYDDSRSPSRAESDEEGLNTQTVSEKYNILPSAGLLLYPEDVEKDDYLHNPGPDDDARECDICSRRGLLNLGGLAFMTLGILMLFIGYPVLTFVRKTMLPVDDGCTNNPMCLDVGPIPLLQNVRTGLIDPDTPESAMYRTTSRGVKQKLVFSDEFNVDGRTFYEGDDAYWTAVDIWYGVTMDLEWYDPDAATTKDGTLNIRFDAFQNHGLNYRSAMLQSWNQFCFKGGHLEASISLPGRGDTIGFWPGFWAMGNLGRPGYASSTEGMWPYSYHDECDAGITANQSQVDGLSALPGMKLPACTCPGEDHPSPGKSRSAPEIDVIEASVGFLKSGEGVGSVSQSLQVAPFDIFWQPDYEFTEIYDHRVTEINGYAGGVFQQALSGVSNLNNDWYDGKAYQRYAFEYVPGDKGYVTWYIGDQKTWTIDHRAVRANGNVGQRPIPVEPMAIIMNFGMSEGFAALNLTGLMPLMPATMRIDYVRVYQDEGHEITTCDPPGYPTTQYIREHPVAYRNPNVTLWENTKYPWPKNSLVHGC